MDSFDDIRSSIMKAAQFDYLKIVVDAVLQFDKDEAVLPLKALIDRAIERKLGEPDTMEMVNLVREVIHPMIVVEAAPTVYSALSAPERVAHLLQRWEHFKNMLFGLLPMAKTVTEQDYEAIGALLAEYDELKAGWVCVLEWKREGDDWEFVDNYRDQKDALVYAAQIDGGAETPSQLKWEGRRSDKKDGRDFECWGFYGSKYRAEWKKVK